MHECKSQWIDFPLSCSGSNFAVPFLEEFIKLQRQVSVTKQTPPTAETLIWTPKLEVLALEYMTQALETASGYKTIKPHVEFLITQVVHPLLSYNLEDAEEWEMDPVDFVRNQTDTFFSISNTPRDASAAFIKAVMRLR